MTEAIDVNLIPESALLIEEGSTWLTNGSIKNQHVEKALTEFRELVDAQYADLGSDRWYSRLVTLPVNENDTLSRLFPLNLSQVELEACELVPAASNVITNQQIDENTKRL